jgi:MFS family permease
MRARVNAVFQMMFAIGMVLFQFLAGWLGQVMSYRLVMVILAGLSLTAMLFLIWIPAEVNRLIYEATRKPEMSVDESSTSGTL